MARQRKKPQNLIPMRDLKAVDAALAEIAQIQRGIRRIEADMNDEIDRLKVDADAKEASLKTRLQALENGILAFAEFNKDELFAKKKTQELTFGLIGYRQSTRISTTRATLEKLQELNFTEAIRVQKSIDREVMHEWPDERLQLVGAKRTKEDKFWYEIKEEEIEDLVA